MVKRSINTKELILNAAAEEIHRNGFQAASIDNILKRTGVTKGALYHHFANKNELGYAVVDEVLAPMVRSLWLGIAEADDPITAAEHWIMNRGREMTPELLELGCPFNNLCQEMAPIDANFRARLHALLEEWLEQIEAAIARAQHADIIRPDLDPKATAIFIVTSFEGAVGMAKVAQSAELLFKAMQSMIIYLNQLRVVNSTQLQGSASA